MKILRGTTEQDIPSLWRAPLLPPRRSDEPCRWTSDQIASLRLWQIAAVLRAVGGRRKVKLGAWHQMDWE